MKKLLIAGVLPVLLSACITPYKDPRSPEKMRQDLTAAVDALAGTYEVVDSRLDHDKVDRIVVARLGNLPILMFYKNGGKDLVLNTGTAICTGYVVGKEPAIRKSVYCTYSHPTYRDVYFNLSSVTNPETIKYPGLLGLTTDTMVVTEGFLLKLRGSSRNEIVFALRRVAD